MRSRDSGARAFLLKWNPRICDTPKKGLTPKTKPLKGEIPACNRDYPPKDEPPRGGDSNLYHRSGWINPRSHNPGWSLQHSALGRKALNYGLVCLFSGVGPPQNGFGFPSVPLQSHKMNKKGGFRGPSLKQKIIPLSGVGLGMLLGPIKLGRVP